MRRQTVRSIPLRVVLDHKQNVRDHVGDVTELAASIRAQGLLQPLVVTEHPNRDGHFLLLAGHRRAAAARTIPLDNVPCLVRHDVVDVTEHIAMMLVENMQRANLSAVEKARGMQKLLDTGMNQAAVARRLGVTAATVNTYVMLLELGAAELDAIESGEVQVGHARKTLREQRQAARKSAGAPTAGRPVQVEPAHLDRSHPLADRIKAACTHSTRPKVGWTGCGQCWEAEIRADEREVAAELSGGGLADAEQATARRG